MLDDAKLSKDLDEEQFKLESKLREVKMRKELISQGDFTFERCIKEIDVAHDLSEDIGEFNVAMKLIRRKYSSEDVDKALIKLGIKER